MGFVFVREYENAKATVKGRPRNAWKRWDAVVEAYLQARGRADCRRLRVGLASPIERRVFAEEMPVVILR